MDAPEGVKIIEYTWDDFQKDRVKLVKLIKKHEKKTGVKFTRVHGIPRGGLVLAVCLSHDLDIEFLESCPRVFDPKTIIVDEIADSGATLKKFRDNGYFIATIHWYHLSKVKPDLWLREKKPGAWWIVYCWEKQERSES